MKLLRRLFVRHCRHQFTWPRVDAHGHHYQICSRCGAAYEYDWQLMRRTDHLLTSQAQHAWQ